MTLWQGVKLYPKAIGWAALIAMCCAMEGQSITSYTGQNNVVRL
jgi:SP family general alpha glucoside:H+ symporter-like MFS transporter